MPLLANDTCRSTRPYQSLLSAVCAVLVCCSSQVSASSAADSDSGFNAALPLFLLGASALLMGIRNLRALRHKPLAQRMRQQRVPTAADEDGDH